MKKCPQCAEQVQDAARVCRHCGHKFASNGVTVAIVTGVVLLAGYLAISVGGRDEAPVTASPTVLAYDGAKLAQCRDVLKKAEKARLIRNQPSSTRIDVDDTAWRLLPAETKRGTLLALACDTYQRPLQDVDYVVAYGYRSGRRVGMLTSVGMKYD